VRDASFARLSDAPGILQRRLMEKKWQYVFVATPEMMLSLAVIDGGYLSSGICAVFDRGARRMLVNDNPVLPPICAQVGDDPADGMSARLLGPAIRARMRRAEGRVSIQATWAHADVDLMLDVSRAPPPITAIAEVGEPGRFDLTQKTVLVPAEGEVRAAIREKGITRVEDVDAVVLENDGTLSVSWESKRPGETSLVDAKVPGGGRAGG